MKLLQWNVWFKENPDNIVKLIKEINPDIVSGQELIQTDSIDTSKYIAGKLGYHYSYKEASRWDSRADIKTQGNAIFSRYPITSTSFHYIQPYSFNPPDASHEGRIYVEASVLIKGKLISFGTAHLSFTPRFTITSARKTEVDNLVNVIKTRKNNYFFSADLNSTPDSYTVMEIKKYLFDAGPAHDEETWTTKPFDKQGFKEDKLNWRLDYVFHTPDVRIKYSKIIPTKFSDHLPILIETE